MCLTLDLPDCFFIIFTLNFGAGILHRCGFSFISVSHGEVPDISLSLCLVCYVWSFGQGGVCQASFYVIPQHLSPMILASTDDSSLNQLLLWQFSNGDFSISTLLSTFIGWPSSVKKNLSPLPISYIGFLPCIEHLNNWQLSRFLPSHSPHLVNKSCPWHLITHPSPLVFTVSFQSGSEQNWHNELTITGPCIIFPLSLDFHYTEFSE